MKFKDYSMIIANDDNGNVFWRLYRKGMPAACNEKEIRMVSRVLGEIKEKIDNQYPIIQAKENFT